MSSRRSQIALVALYLVLAGCSSDSDPVRPQPTPLPANDTPANTAARFMAAYERKDATAWEELFTEDFTFEFSNAVDPTLAAQYAGGWFKNDEALSAQHLFQGFTNGSGLVVPAAKSIDVNLAPTTPQPDASTADLVRFFQLLAEVDATVVIPPGTGQTEETTYLIDNNRHRLFLVRGDAVPGELTAEQPADSLHWYIYRWKDETTNTASRAGAELATERSTWGRLKAQYR
jgi:hypothetical protein